MIRAARYSKARNRDQVGFTLIELLVVIVILGILAAVVVFAIRGSGDKGKRAAIDTDARTIRTAEEAYCARAGHYARMGQLTGEEVANDGNKYKFLSEPSSYHTVDVFTDGGPCGGTRFEINCNQDPDCAAVIPPPPPIRKGGWEKSGDLTTFSGLVWDMVALNGTGRIVVVAGNPVTSPPVAGSLYDSTTGQWAPRVAIPGGVRKAVVVPGTTSTTCPRCGKVLIQMQTAFESPGARDRNVEWVLYDPEQQTLEQLPPSKYWLCDSTSLTPLTNGKVLKTGCGLSLETGGFTRNEIFDPSASSAGAPWTIAASAPQTHHHPVVVRLASGNVLVVGGGKPPQLGDPPDSDASSKAASLYSPATGWSSLPPSFNAHNMIEQAILLRDGRVLLVNGSQSELYNPNAPVGVNPWKPVPCAEGGGPCPLPGGTGGSSLSRGPRDSSGPATTLLRSGRVLVVGGEEPAPSSVTASRRTILFNPVDGTWFRAEDMPAASSGRGGGEAQTLGGTSCGPSSGTSNCGKAILAGGSDGGDGRSTWLFTE